MELATFIQGLLTEGKLTVRGVLISFEQADLGETQKLLEEYYREDALEMSYTAPAFAAAAALWAAGFFYTAVQLTVIREAGEAEIKQQLMSFQGSYTPETIYSADLVLRHLPALCGLAKGLAPADILVQELYHTGRQWPFSSVGMELGEVIGEEIIFSHPSLRQAYIDRIIANKDKQRAAGARAQTILQETTGSHTAGLWPGFEPLLK